jgi:hypothetical protein
MKIPSGDDSEVVLVAVEDDHRVAPADSGCH